MHTSHKTETPRYDLFSSIRFILQIISERIKNQSENKINREIEWDTSSSIFMDQLAYIPTDFLLQ